MKRIIVGISVILSAVTILTNPVSVLANTGETAALGAEAATLAYDASVVARMANRAGAATPNGAKGVAFEIMYMDQLNCKNYFKDVTTRLTKSSTATQSDLVTVNNSGQIVQRIQCKNVLSESGIKQTIDKLPQYRGTELVGTTESAEAFNSTAESLGVTKRMIDSKIPVEATERVAEKALCKMPSAVKVAKTAGKGAAAGAILSAGVAAI